MKHLGGPQDYLRNGSLSGTLSFTAPERFVSDSKLTTAVVRSVARGVALQGWMGVNESTCSSVCLLQVLLAAQAG